MRKSTGIEYTPLRASSLPSTAATLNGKKGTTGNPQLAPLTNSATLYRREHGLEVARVLLGHKHAAITEIYAEADHQRAAEVISLIG